MSTTNKNWTLGKLAALALTIALFAATLASLASSTPFGATVTYVSNTSKAATNGTAVNYTGGGTSAGGYIFVTNLTGIQQNLRWKGFVGNITGKFTLDDASGNTLYDWSLVGAPSGTVLATRTSGTVTWANIKCAYLNVTNSEAFRMNHTNPSDNLTKTFPASTNPQFTVGAVTLSANTCNTTKLYVNDSSPSGSVFFQSILYDGGATLLTNDTSLLANVVYAALIEADVSGFDTKTYDFQMILPENGLASWTSSTAYYFYIELT